MAGLGAVSGALSVSLGFDSATWLQPVAALFGLVPELMPVGFYFSVAVALGIWLGTGNLWAVPVLLITTMYAWSAAIQVAIRLQRNSGDDPHLIAASLAAGAVGATLTHLGCAVFSRALRRPLAIAVTCTIGAVVGMLFYLGERRYIGSSLLYVVWQPAVAFCIGMGLAGRGRDA